MTLNEYIRELQKIAKKGGGSYGDYEIVSKSDDEGNSYRKVLDWGIGEVFSVELKNKDLHEFDWEYGVLEFDKNKQYTHFIVVN